MTPEGKIKRAVNKTIARYPSIWGYMPVPFGYGKATLDYLLCARGNFIGIETKAPGQKPTNRQLDTIQKMIQAGAIVFIIDNEQDAELKLGAYLKELFGV